MTQDEAQRRRWTFYEAVKFAAQNKVMYTKITLESKGVDSPLIHHQDTICRVAVVRSSLRRIGQYASVVAPWRLASDALLVIRNAPNPMIPIEDRELGGGFGFPVTRLRKENGTVTTVALIILAICSIIGAISSKITQADLNLSNAYIQQKQAFYAAESGLNYATAKMGSLTDRPDDPNWSATVHGNLPTGESFTVVLKHKVAGGKVVKWADINNDFVFKECTSCPGSPVERIISTGFSRGGSQQSVATELFPEPLFADIPAAIYAGGDSMISNSGSAIAEGEFGYIADKAVCLELPDVVTTPSALDGFRATDFSGRTGLRPSLLNDQEPYPLARVIENLKGRAVTITHETRLVLGSSEDYGLYYCPESIDAQHLSGYGILMIDGNARLGGSVDWHGLILAKGDTQFDGSGSKEIFGGFLSGGRVLIDSPSAFYYDCREMNSMKKKFSRYGRRLWTCDIPLNW